MKPDDFEELLANCADEPIRTPGAIQPHGVLLTLSEPDLHILQVSANVGTLFGHAPESLLGQPLHTLIGAEHAHAVQAMAEDNTFFDAHALHIHFNGVQFEGLLHRHQDVLVLEFEPRLEDFKPRALNGRTSDLGKMLQRLQSAKTLQALYEISVNEIQTITGYDRVLIYRFEEEGHGQVIAEASAPSMELFNGLFFPASDIPEQARELYRTNWLRIIPNAAYEPVPMLPKLLSLIHI